MNHLQDSGERTGRRLRPSLPGSDQGPLLEQTSTRLLNSLPDPSCTSPYNPVLVRTLPSHFTRTSHPGYLFTLDIGVCTPNHPQGMSQHLAGLQQSILLSRLSQNPPSPVTSPHSNFPSSGPALSLAVDSHWLRLHLELSPVSPQL